MNIVVFGASVAYGEGDNYGGWVERIKRHFGGKDNTWVYNLGIPGNTSSDLLDRIETELYARADEDGNNIALIEVGVNDSQVDIKSGSNEVLTETFHENLIKIISICRKYQTKCVLIGLLPVDKQVYPMPWKPTHGYLPEQIEKYNKVVEETAGREDVPFIDLYTKFVESDWRLLLEDGVHPNEKGHQLIFEIVKARLQF